MNSPKKTHEECQRILREAEAEVLTIYTHLKSGNLYHVKGVALRESDLEPVVIYQPLEGLSISFSRPLKEFREKFKRKG